MPPSDSPCLSLAIDRLRAASAAHYAIWVLQSPFPGGYGHHDCIWPEKLMTTWQAWQQIFSLRGLPEVPRVSLASLPDLTLSTPSNATGTATPNNQPIPMTAQLMQLLGVNLWQWLFDGPIQNSLNQSQGIAIGQAKPLRVRLDIRDPELIALPWEIMQPQAGKQAISLSRQMLFSRTTSDVDPLAPLKVDKSLRILLVLGQELETHCTDPMEVLPSGKPLTESAALKLEEEAATLARVLETSGQSEVSLNGAGVSCQVDTLIQPTPGELIEALETEAYNILFYAGHGVTAPDGGLLLLRAGTTLGGTELAQVLTRCRVKLAVFNACWGAQPDYDRYSTEAGSGERAIPRSSLAEVLIHHGVPAVLGMRDSITDEEAISFIQAFAQGLAERRPIDEAVAMARQHLLMLYRFNQPAWTLPVLYMHPDFDGELVKPAEEGMTELPGDSPTQTRSTRPIAMLRLVGHQHKVWPIRDGLMRVGRKNENDLVIPEQWVSQKHAEIFCRDVLPESNANGPTYFLRDFSRFGTLILDTEMEDWQKVHHQEVPLQSGTQLKFGSSHGQALEFIIQHQNVVDVDDLQS